MKKLALFLGSLVISTVALVQPASAQPVYHHYGHHHHYHHYWHHHHHYHYHR